MEKCPGARRSWRPELKSGRDDSIACEDIADFPARDDIGDTAIFFDSRDFQFRHEFAVAIDEEPAIFFNTTGGADIQDHEVIFRINGKNVAFEPRREGLLQIGIIVEKRGELCLGPR